MSAPRLAVVTGAGQGRLDVLVDNAARPYSHRGETADTPATLIVEAIAPRHDATPTNG